MHNAKCQHSAGPNEEGQKEYRATSAEESAIDGPYMIHAELIAVFHARRLKQDGPYDSQLLPFLLTTVLMVSLLITFGGSVAKLAGWQGSI